MALRTRRRDRPDVAAPLLGEVNQLCITRVLHVYDAVTDVAVDAGLSERVRLRVYSRRMATRAASFKLARLPDRAVFSGPRLKLAVEGEIGSEITDVQL